MKLHIVAAIILLICFFGLADITSNTSQKIKKLYTNNLLQLKEEVTVLSGLVKEKKSIAKIKDQFVRTRISYKKIEVFVEYYNPATAKAINGAAIPEVESDNPQYPVAPTGFQVIEELIYNDELTSYNFLKQQITALDGAVNRLIKVNESTDFTDKHIFDAIKSELFRITTLSLSGFDTPISQLSILEINPALSEIINYLNSYNNNNSQHFNHLNHLVKQSEKFINRNNDFNKFDRAAFIIIYLQPIGKSLNAFQEQKKIAYFEENRPLNASAATLFSKDAFNPYFFASDHNTIRNNNTVKLGKLLFFESMLSSNGKRNCGSCHNPNKAFTDGLAKNVSFDGEKLILRNTPTILYSSLQASQFYDSRTSFLEDQAKQVIENPLEMHGNLNTAAQNLSSNVYYKKMFKQAYQSAKITPQRIQMAIADFIRSKNAFNSRFDYYMRDDKTALNKQEIKGFNLFMGKGKCGTCHFVPVFNGSIPPGFYKSESEVLGVPKVFKANYMLDEDQGKYVLYQAKPHLNSFKTPTLRNVSKTAPYMHNGSFNSLNDVLDFYNEGGGAGLGITIENQTLPSDKLNLTSIEKQSIIAFLKTLNDKED